MAANLTRRPVDARLSNGQHSSPEADVYKARQAAHERAAGLGAAPAQTGLGSLMVGALAGFLGVRKGQAER